MEKELNCGSIDCNRGKKDCCSMLKKMIIPAVLGDDSEGSDVAPCNGAYRNMIVEYEANGTVYIYSSDGIYTKLGNSLDENEAASVAFVVEKDREVLRTAKQYTDNSIADLSLSLTQYADNVSGDALTEAKAYADQQDAAILLEAKAYADSQTASGASVNYVDQQDATVLSDAKLYADGVSATAAGAVQSNLTQLQTSLSPVATSGSYNDLSNTPDVPVFTLTNVDPGEGQPLEANHFICVYSS